MSPRWCALLLTLLLAGSGCQTTTAPDPLGVRDRSLRSRLAPTRSAPGRGLAGRSKALPSGDPFAQATPTPEGNRPAGHTGRVTLSDGFGDDHHDAAAQRSEALAARPAGQRVAGIQPVGGIEEQRSHGVSPAPFESESTAPAAAADASALRQQLQDLEWDLQFTDDHARQEQLALQIARLRKQLARGGR